MRAVPRSRLPGLPLGGKDRCLTILQTQEEAQTCSPTRARKPSPASSHVSPWGPGAACVAALSVPWAPALSEPHGDCTPLQPPGQSSPLLSLGVRPAPGRSLCHTTPTQGSGALPAVPDAILCPVPLTAPGAELTGPCVPSPFWTLRLQASLSKGLSSPNHLSLSPCTVKKA